MRVVLWHYIQLGVGKQTGSVPYPAHDEVENAELQVASPILYAAFNGLGVIVEQLHKLSANQNYASSKLRYGSPLMAAIFGLSQRRYTTRPMATIETLVLLDTTRGALDEASNAGELGRMTPIHAAVQPYTAYTKRAGLDSEPLFQVIRFLLNEGAHVDPKVRSMAQSSGSELRKYFSDAPCRTALSSWATEFASSPPIPIPSPRQSRGPGNATIGALGPLGVTTALASAAWRRRVVQPADIGWW